MSSEHTGLEIAIIGMAGRFPGAASTGELWRNLCAGVESIARFTSAELLAEGLDPAEVGHPDYVPAKGVLAGTDLFDAEHFGMSPAEARLTDPQHRLLLECAWQALEDAGYDPAACPGPAGIYAGAGMNLYLADLFARREALAEVDVNQLMVANDKDHLATRVAYRLGLEGPAVTVQTACSTSLVAVHLAVQALLSGECDLALAGGVAAWLPERAGYLFRDGMIRSADGHCRPFGAGERGGGTVPGNGVGLVVLRRLEDARAAGDAVRALIRGSAINNDGSQKVGYSAPRADTQARVIRAAQLMAEVGAESIGYVEGHGTGTPMGDSIEVAALTRAFRATTPARGFCALGSLKGNLGHLDAAAGIAGLIKTVLALEHRRIPPSLYCQPANPELPLADSPFVLAAELADFAPPAGGGPRRAAVSSFGIGGTNAHVILEEAPLSPPSPPRGEHQLLLLSARRPAALEPAAAELAAELAAHPELPLADVAYTLGQGRRAWSWRRAVVAESGAAAVAALRQPEPAQEAEAGRGVAFLFPGQGAQYLGMGAEVCAAEPLCREVLDACCAELQGLLGVDPRPLLAAPATCSEKDLERAELLQPLLFAVEYALARLWQSWGVEPQALLGHSVGEYVAACLGGLWRWPDALRLLAARGRLVATLPPGAMLAVTLPAARLEERLAALGGELALAASNGPEHAVAAGPLPAVAELERRLAAEGVHVRRLHTSHAFHSPMMEPILDAFAAEVAAVPRQTPERLWLSNLSGTWIRAEEAVDPAYWVRHLRQPVRFGEALEELLRAPGLALLEVGPGRTLTTLAARHPLLRDGTAGDRPVVASLRHPRQEGSERACLLRALGSLWCAGVAVDGAAFWAPEPRRRVSLPGIVLQRQRFSVREVPAPPPIVAVSPPALLPAPSPAELRDVFYLPVWHQAPPPPPGRSWAGHWLLFADAGGLLDELAGRLEARGGRVTRVAAGDCCARLQPGHWCLRPGEGADYRQLLAELAAAGELPDAIVHGWNLDPEVPAAGARGEPEGVLAALEAGQERGFFSLFHLARALGDHALPAPLAITVLSCGLHLIAGEVAPRPVAATLLGPCRVLPREDPRLSCRSIDLEPPPPGAPRNALLAGLLAVLLDELAAPAATAPPLVAWRDQVRWLPALAPLPLPAAEPERLPLRDGGVYLLTGGLGAMGLAFAERFAARRSGVRLALVGRTLPAPAAPPPLAGLFAADVAGDAALVRELADALAARLAVRELEDEGDLVPLLDQLCAAHAFACLGAAGGELALTPGRQLRRAELRAALGVQPRYHRFFDYLLGLLVADGLVTAAGEDLTVRATPPPASELSRQLCASHPGFAGLAELLDHCAGHLRPVLAGEVEPLSVLFPDGRRELLQRTLGRTADLGRRTLCCTLAAELLARLAASRPLRVLEVGGGAGSLTRTVVAALAAAGGTSQVEYWFTDLGRAFVRDAERHAAEQGLDFLRFAVLDIARDAVAQGFAAGSFDLILGLDVVHATPRLAETCRHLRRLLAPGGALWLIEQTRPRRWAQLIWGLTEGWWSFADHRVEQPLLDAAGWQAVLAEAGFAATGGPAGDYALITGRAPAAPDEGAAVQQRLARLRAAGAEVELYAADVADPVAMAAVVAQVRGRWGAIHGAVHAAGQLRPAPLRRQDPESARRVLDVKVRGAVILDHLLAAEPLDFFVLCSSLSALGGASGQADYAAANAFLDHFAQLRRRRGGRPVTAINWDRWRREGMAVAVERARLAGPGGREVHPLLGRCRHRGAERQIFAAELSAATAWVLDEHRMAGQPVLPGTAYLEMARAAWTEAGGAGAVELADVLFHAPLIVPAGSSATVLTVLDRAHPEPSAWSFRVLSEVPGPAGERRFRLHAEGRVHAAAGPPSDRAGALRHADALRALPAGEPSRSDFDTCGRRWQNLQGLHFGDGEALAELTLDEAFAPDLPAFALHPALVDVATSFATGRWLDGTHVPLGYRRLRLHGALTPRLTSIAHRRDAGREALSVDLVLLDPSGQVLAEVEGFTKRRVDPEQAAARLRAGVAASAQGPLLAADLLPELGSAPEPGGLEPEQGVEALERILASGGLAQVVVSTRPLPALHEGHDAPSRAAQAVAPSHRSAPAASVPSGGDDLQGRLARIWSEVLGVPRVGPDDNFFDLGGDSILGLQVVSRAREAGLDLTPGQVFEHQTIATLAAALATSSPREPQPPPAPAITAEPRPTAELRPEHFPLAGLDQAGLGKLLGQLAELDGEDSS